jgi:site-specific recombinase XerD
MFGEDLGLQPLLNIKTAQIQKWYDQQVTPHIMRHTFASLLAIKGVSLYKIANWPGDTLATTEKHYAHLLPTDPDIEHLNGANSKTRKSKKGKK